MNEINFKLEVLMGNEIFEYDGITYSNCAFIKLIIDGVDIMKEREGRKGIVVWDELKKTKNSSGDFLILTCFCGVADDGGFSLVSVDQTPKIVKWFFYDNTKIIWMFDKKDYDLKLSKLSSQIEKLTVKLEPTNIIFPE